MEADRRQPDFHSISHGFTDLATEFERCVNLPVVQGGEMFNELRVAMEALTQTLVGVQRQLTSLENKVDTGFQRLAGQITSVQQRLSVTEKNAQVRSMNATANRPESTLEPLCSVITGDPVAGFPSTLQALLSLTGRQMNPMMVHVGLSDQGTVEEKRRRLLWASGVTQRAV